MTAVAASMVTSTGDVWDFSCAVFAGNALCGFQSTGWPTKKVAVARADQHLTEHKEHVPMPDLDTFRAEHGLTSAGTLPDGAVRLEDL